MRLYSIPLERHMEESPLPSPPSLFFSVLSRPTSQLLLCLVLQSPNHFGGSPLHMLQYVCVCLALGSPKLDVLLEI